MTFKKRRTPTTFLLVIGIVIVFFINFMSTEVALSYDSLILAYSRTATFSSDKTEIVSAIQVLEEKQKIKPTASKTTKSGKGYGYLMTDEDKKIINMSDEELVQAALGMSSLPEYNQNGLQATVESNLVQVPVKIWQLDSSGNKVAKDVNITVNKVIKDIVLHIFTELYQNTAKPLISVTGGYSFRTKNNGTGTTKLSTHAYGFTIDLNFTNFDGSKLNWNWNPSGGGYGKPGTAAEFAQNPLVIYEEGEIVKTFYAYSFRWGGQFSSSFCDPMHFSFIGDSYKRESNRGNMSKVQSSTTTSAKGEEVIEYAKQFLGNPYVWGGTSLTNGCDCSGFVMSIYAHFGFSLPHSSAADRSIGKGVKYEDAQPGDIICYSGHAALYMGNDMIIGAQSKKTGITTQRAQYRTILAVRRLIE